MIAGFRGTCLFGALLLAVACSAEELLGFRVQLEVARQELAPDFCWFHPRVAAIPGGGREGGPAVLMTLQKHLRVSDFYSGLWMMQTDDLGAKWVGPTEIAALGWSRGSDGIVEAVADVTPGWHAPSGKLIAIGCSVRYSPEGRQLSDVAKFSQTAYAVYDPAKDAWSPWQILELPDVPRFNLARNGCGQWLVEEDGTVLVPIYFGETSRAPFSATVLRCGFDGTRLEYREHGTELALAVVRGLCEPSIAKYRGRYYLTIRNDERGYVTTSNDSLRYRPIKPWVFDDGGELGSYNTQQHWLVHSEGLFLAYTRRGADNAHIMRNRAPLFLAQVDPERLCVIRATEQAVVPERGVPLGNFGAAAISAAESWITDAEYMDSADRNPRGADGSVFVARIIWSKPNALISAAH